LETQVLPATDPRAIERAILVLSRGGLVAFPTDTVYGLGALAWNPAGVAKLYAAKQRPADKAIPLLLSGLAQLHQVTENLPPTAVRLIAEFWPGALTLILPRSQRVPDVVTAGGDSVAVRVPDQSDGQRLLAGLDAPLAATSANLSGQANPLVAGDVLAQLRGRIDLVLDGGPSPGDIPSTVLDLTSRPPRILRPGPLAQAVGRLLGID